MNIVISQSMYFPWVGMLEQARLSDIFVHYDDVQFSKGSFTNRVQIKSEDGLVRWMTIPLVDRSLGKKISEIYSLPKEQWLTSHIGMLKGSFKTARFSKDAISIAEQVLEDPSLNLADIARKSMLALFNYFEIDVGVKFIDSKELDIPGGGSERVFGIVRALGGTNYITGHGAINYLNHELFERNGIQVCYMDYKKLPYEQSHGIFTPYVSSLDLVAHMGKRGLDHISSNAVNWRSYRNEPI